MGLQLLVNDSHGVYVPIVFAQSYDRKEWGLTKTDLIPLKKGPEHEWYWEAWDSVLNKAEHKDKDGNVWTLHQDGDLWAVCPELMTNEEYEDFFGEIKPPPDGWHDYAACQDCLCYIANDDLPPDNTAEQDQHLIESVRKLEGYVVADGADLGFVDDNCEICGALPGQRYRVLVQPREAV